MVEGTDMCSGVLLRLALDALALVRVELAPHPAELLDGREALAEPEQRVHERDDLGAL